MWAIVPDYQEKSHLNKIQAAFAFNSVRMAYALQLYVLDYVSAKLHCKDSAFSKKSQNHFQYGAGYGTGTPGQRGAEIQTSDGEGRVIHVRFGDFGVDIRINGS